MTDNALADLKQINHDLADAITAHRALINKAADTMKALCAPRYVSMGHDAEFRAAAWKDHVKCMMDVAGVSLAEIRAKLDGG